MTGTAMTEAEEFHKIYGLEVVAIPTHRPMVRDDLPDLVYKNEISKFNALIDEIEEMTSLGRPVLVGTVSVEKSEVLSTLLKRRGVKHETLNAKQHERESLIVAQAGRSGTVTIATNMAGRGTDIQLGGNPAGLASEILHKQGLNPAEVDAATYDAALEEAKATTSIDHDKVVEAGGLHIIGTERHDSRRIDNQLRGRSGRQGDPGSSRFYLSLDDDLMKRFASERVAGLMERLGLEDDVAIESNLVSKTIASAQNRVEGFNFDIRKRVVEFDDVINKQRETIYAERDKVLRNEDLTETVRDFLEAEVDAMADQYLGGDTPAEWSLEGLAVALQAMGITGPGTTEAELDEFRTRDELVGHLHELVDEALETREQEHGEEVWSQVERFVLLRTIDSLWVEHLTEIDDMRRGIGLRGYAQQDPLNEFRKEAFRLYEELSDLIRRQVATTIFRVTRHPRAARRSRCPGPASRPADPCSTRMPTVRSTMAQPHDETSGNGSGSGRAAAVATSAGAASAIGGAAATSATFGRITTTGAGPVSGLPADPMRTAREVPGDASATNGVRQGFTPVRRPDRAQRPVLVRFGPEVQEVSRGLSARIAGGIVRSVVVAGAARRRRGRVRGAPHLAAGRASTRNAPPTRSSSSARPSTTAGRPRCSRRGSTTRSRLYRAGVAPNLVVTGGKRPGDRTTEAAVARRYAIDHGVPAEAIFGEDEARNTLDSLRAVGRAMHDRGLSSAVFVSDPTHMLRVAPDRERPRAGGVLVADRGPRRSRSIAVRVARATIHELGALAVYLVTGGGTAASPALIADAA